MGQLPAEHSNGESEKQPTCNHGDSKTTNSSVFTLAGSVYKLVGRQSYTRNEVE